MEKISGISYTDPRKRKKVYISSLHSSFQVTSCHNSNVTVAMESGKIASLPVAQFQLGGAKGSGIKKNLHSSATQNCAPLLYQQ